MSNIKTPEFYLDEVSKEKIMQLNWIRAVDWFSNGDLTRKDFDDIVIESMRRYAEDACKEQREICADYADTKSETNYAGEYSRVGKLYETVVSVDTESILNAPSPIE